jgi:hypothetical protein
VTEPLDPASVPPAPAPSATLQPPGPDHEPGFDERRNVIARAKGLPGEIIEGGEDPNPAEGLREERTYGRWLVAMVVALILFGFVVGLAIALAQA